MLPARDAYELWAESYPPVAHNPLMRVEQDVVEPLLSRIRATRALDVGTGSGRYLPLLRATGASAVVGVDFSLAMLRRGAAAGRVCGDACRLPLQRASFDLINASLMVGDVADLGAWTREMARALSPGGQLVYSDFHPSWLKRGWRRTFRSADGELHDIAFNPHTIDQHLAALDQAGFGVRTIREPRLNISGGEERGIRAFQLRWGHPQVVVVFHAVKEP